MNSRFHRSLRCLCVFATIASAQIDPSPRLEKEPISIRGRLVDATTGESLPGIRITAQTFDWATSAETLSGPDGRFAFTGLPPKPHSLSAYVDGNVIYYSSRPAFAANGEIWTIGDTGGKEILFRVAPGPIVTGAITDEFADPIEGATVELFRAEWLDGKLVFLSNGMAATDDRGRFRLSPSAGSYILCARRDKDLASQNAPAPGAVDFLSSGAPRVYRQTCTSEPPTAGFQVAPGDVREVNLKLASGPALSLQGRITGGMNGSVPSLQLSRNDLLLNNPHLTWSGNDFRFAALDPGSYRLRAELYDGGPGGARVASQTIQLGNSDVSDLNLALELAPVIELSIRPPANYVLPPPAVQIRLRQWARDSFAGTEPDASHRFWGLDPGSAWLVTRTFDEHVCVESARLQGQDVLQRPFVIPSGVTANIEVTLSNTCSTIQGAVFSQNRPLPFAHVAVLLSGSPADPGDVFTENANQDGKFQVVSLPPGRYLLWAWGRDDPSFVGPVSLGSVESQASAVVVGRGQTVSAAVVAIPTPGAPK